MLTPFWECTIEQVEGARPVKSKRYYMSPKQEEEVATQVKNMVENLLTEWSWIPLCRISIILRHSWMMYVASTDRSMQ